MNIPTKRLLRGYAIFAQRASILSLAFFGYLLTNSASADLLIDLEDSATASQFNNDVANNTAGPFDIDGVSTMFTTSAVTGFVATDTFGLGINSGGGDSDLESFNIGESWSFFADQHLFLTGLELGGLQSEETFRIQSDSWINLSNINPGAGVTYEAGTGTFLLTDGPSGDIFTLAELTGGERLRVYADSILTLGNLSSSLMNDDVELENITFRINPIPEPGSGLVCLLGLVAVSQLRSRRKRTVR